MTTFLLVRHAFSTDTGKRLTGWNPGVHLSDKGREQADELGHALAGAKIDAIYSSPIERTVETARAIAAHHDLKVMARRDLGEVDYGDWSGQTFGRLKRTKLWSVVQRWPSRARFPQGESIPEVQARAVSAIDAIGEERKKGTVCVVSHGDVIKLILAHYLGVHIDLYQRIVVGCASVSVLVLHDEGPHVVMINAPASVGAKVPS